MGFSDDDTEILPIIPEYDKVYLPLVKSPFTELELRALALFTPPFAARPAVVIQDEITYVPEFREGCTWVVSDANSMPYHALHGTSKKQADSIVKDLHALFSESGDLSK